MLFKFKERKFKNMYIHTYIAIYICHFWILKYCISCPFLPTSSQIYYANRSNLGMLTGISDIDPKLSQGSLPDREGGMIVLVEWGRRLKLPRQSSRLYDCFSLNRFNSGLIKLSITPGGSGVVAGFYKSHSSFKIYSTRYISRSLKCQSSMSILMYILQSIWIC